VAARRSAATATRAARAQTKREPAERKPARKPDLSIVSTQVFRGPNYWSYEPCIRLLVDLGSLEHWPSNTIPRFNDRLLKMLPGVGEHSCSLGKRGGFRERLADGTWLGHVAEHVALELQRESGAHISRGKTRGAGSPGQYNVIYGYAEEQVGIAAGKLAVRLLNNLVKSEEGFDFRAELDRLIILADRRQYGPSTQAILDEAATRDIPWLRLNEYSLVQLGQGKYQQRIRATMTSKTSALAVDVASDKKMTNQLLASAGLPVRTAEVAQRMGIRREHLSRQFAAGGAPNLKRVIDLLRVITAAQLLANPGYSVADTARLLGFASKAHLGLTVGRIAGVEAAELRRMAPGRVFEAFVRGAMRSRS